MGKEMCSQCLWNVFLVQVWIKVLRWMTYKRRRTRRVPRLPARKPEESEPSSRSQKCHLAFFSLQLSSFGLKKTFHNIKRNHKLTKKVYMLSHNITGCIPRTSLSSVLFLIYSTEYEKSLREEEKFQMASQNPKRAAVVTSQVPFNGFLIFFHG